MSTAIIPAPSGGGTITVDTALDTTSTRPVQNKAIATAVNNLNNNKQDTLVSGTNIKTINSQSLLGSGNIDISSGGTITIDGELSDTSENPVQNKVIKAALDAKYTKPSGGIPASDLASGVIPTIDSSLDASSTRAVQNKVVKAAIDAKYTKPSGGIPASDLASGVIPTIDSSLDSSSTRAVQNKVVKAAIDAKYTKPSGGIPASDIASGVIPTIPSIDSSLDASSTRAVQNKVVKAAIDGKYTKPSTGIPASDLASGVIPTIPSIDSSLDASSTRAVQNKVVKAAIDGKYTKPSTGIPASDLASGVIPNTFSNIKVGSTTIAADSKTDTLTLVAGTNVTLTPDATNDKITIAASGGGGSRTYTKPWYINTSGTVVECDSIQAAINGCPVHGAVHIPWYGTTYTISSSLTINKPLTLTSDYYGYENGEQTSEATRTEVTKMLISYTGTDYAIKVSTIGVIIDNISIYTNGGGIYVNPNRSQSAPYSRYNRLNNVYIQCASNSSLGNTGINLYHTFKTVLENCVVFGSRVAFYIEGTSQDNPTTSITMTNCWARDYKLYGYCIMYLAYSSLINCCADTTPTSSDSLQIAYYMVGCWAVGMSGCGCENVGSYAYSIENCKAMTCGMHIVGTNKASGDSPIMIYNSEVSFIGCRNSTTKTNAFTVTGNSSCITLVGCSAMETAIINGTSTHCDGRLWVYPSTS